MIYDTRSMASLTSDDCQMSPLGDGSLIVEGTVAEFGRHGIRIAPTGGATLDAVLTQVTVPWRHRVRGS
jgi:hypothetical protein